MRRKRFSPFSEIRETGRRTDNGIISDRTHFCVKRKHVARPVFSPTEVNRSGSLRKYGLLPILLATLGVPDVIFLADAEFFFLSSTTCGRVPSLPLLSCLSLPPEVFLLSRERRQLLLGKEEEEEGKMRQMSPPK